MNIDVPIKVVQSQWMTLSRKQRDGLFGLSRRWQTDIDIALLPTGYLLVVDTAGDRAWTIDPHGAITRLDHRPET